MTPTYPVHCCDCEEYIAETTCEITASSPYTFCQSCLAQFDEDEDPTREIVLRIQRDALFHAKPTPLNPKP